MAVDSKISTTKTLFCISSITCLVFCIILISLFIFIPSPSLLSYLGYADSVALANADNINEPFTSYMIGELVRNGTLINLKDVWSFQTAFYQTIITFLIAINALIAAISVIYIKSTSEEKAEDTTKKYMHSASFDVILTRKVESEAESRLREAQSDLQSTLADMSDYSSWIERLDEENRTLRQQLKVVSERVAQLDKSEAEDGGLILSRKES